MIETDRIAQECPNLYGIYRLAADKAESHPLTSKLVIHGLRNVMREQGISDVATEAILLDTHVSLILEDAKEELRYGEI